MEKNDEINYQVCIEHFKNETSRLVLLRNGKEPEWDDEKFHEFAYSREPEVYALSSIEDISPEEKEKILFQILKESRKGLDKEICKNLDRVVSYLLTILHPDKVLKVFLALKRVRANHKHTSRAITGYIFNHPCLENLALRRKPSLVHCLEHAIGKNTLRGYIKMLNGEKADKKLLKKSLLRRAKDKDRVKEVLLYLYRKKPLSVKEENKYDLIHKEYIEKISRKKEEIPKTITATNRGNVSATLYHIYRGGKNPELQNKLGEYVRRAAEKLPFFKGNIAVVLDASESTRGYGDREFCCISQSVALLLVLEKCCSQLTSFISGGKGEPPYPEGNTDLALPLIHALETEPDVVAIISDGFENVYRGDLARVTASLPAMDINTPVIFCHSKFTDKDDLELRRPAPLLPECDFWHEEDFEHVITFLASTARGDEKKKSARDLFLEKLEKYEKEMKTWISLN